jgi:hypothetical protein
MQKGGIILDFPSFPELFSSNPPLKMIWGYCSKMEENCPFHHLFQSKLQKLDYE